MFLCLGNVIQTFQTPFNSLIEFGNRDRRLTHSVVSPHSGQGRNKARMSYGGSQQKRIVYAVHRLTFFETSNQMYDIREVTDDD